MERFYWLVPGALAGCSRPGGTDRRQSGPSHEEIAKDLDWLRSQGIAAVLSLTEHSLPEDLLAERGIDAVHIPIVDMQPPTAEQFSEALRFIDLHRARSEPVAVHCLMGQGRTGSILAAYLIREGMSRAQALDELRAICPHAVENSHQENALDAFAARRDWII